MHSSIKFIAICSFGLAAAGPVLSQSEPVTLDLPSTAIETGTDEQTAIAYAFPLEPWMGDETRTNSGAGDVTRRSFALRGSTSTPLQVLMPIRENLEVNGYTIEFECADRDCGGFDFRFLLDLLAAPAMHVDLGNYRYLIATRGAAEVISIVTSRSSQAAFIHVTLAEERDIATNAPTETVVLDAPVRAPETLAERLEAEGRITLESLDFSSGSSEMDAAELPEIAALAEYLNANPSARIALVGHTDAVGGLDANTRLSQARASAVQSLLNTRYGVGLARMVAEGVGFLAPRASNLTEDGRRLNRRVEAVLLEKE